MYNKIEMSNNLNFYIKRAGLTQARVAEMVGIRPESVNRHCSGRSAFSVNDAMTYAKILDCLPEQLLFEKKPAECIGHVHHLGRVDFKNKDEPRHFVTMHHSAPENIKLLKLNIAVGELSPLDGSFYMVNYDPIKNNYVDPDCFGRFCVMKCVHSSKELRNTEDFCYKIQGEKDLWAITRVGILYPQVVLGRDEKTYTFQNFYTKKIFTDIKPIYAASVVANVLRPDLLGWEEFEK
jgi:DNA-binding XRE family transcriptional regulator